MTDAELDRLEQIANSATPGPWSSYFTGDSPDDEHGAFVFRRVDGPPPATDADVWADNGTYIASKREINRGYCTVTGESVLPEDVPLRPCDALFIAACREAVPKLIAEVRRLRTPPEATK